MREGTLGLTALLWAGCLGTSPASDDDGEADGDVDADTDTDTGTGTGSEERELDPAAPYALVELFTSEG